MSLNRRSQLGSFSPSFAWAFVLGLLITAVFYGLILSGPLDFAFLRRYCLSHWVAVASVAMFFVALVLLTFKWTAAISQLRLERQAHVALAALLTEADDILPAERTQWLEASWRSQPAAWQFSWFGQRLQSLLELQLKRGNRSGLESDLKDLAEADADRQHDSYSLLRIITWAMPMLGFLGTVLGISATLGQLDTKLLASQSEQAMNQLTAGLYVAFDTTALGLVLTVIAMFAQFTVARMELSLLVQIDRGIQECTLGFLGTDPHDAEAGLFLPVRQMADELIKTVRQLSEQQAEVWSRSIAESQRQWTQWTQTASERIETNLGETMSASLSNHADRMQKIQDEGARQIDTRWQQWQLTLSEQARTIHAQQKEIVRQSDAIQQLVSSTCELRKLEDVIQDSFSRMENLNRLEEASQCVGEAVAVLATCLERAGVIRGAPIRPRAVRLAESHEETDGTQQRKAA